MRVYVVFAGGGVNGAAHAGCLTELEQRHFVPMGYAGSSAGSLIATLAAIGYSAEEIKDISINLDFKSFLPDKGALLASAVTLKNELSQSNLSFWKKIGLSGNPAVKTFLSSRGLYSTEPLRKKLLELIKGRYKGIGADGRITFAQLRDAGCKSLKIIASDIMKFEAKVFSSNGGSDDICITEAVAASCCYPVVFQPVKIGNNMYVDGGLASNLPVFAFEEERQKIKYPVLAFDLVQLNSATPPENLGSYLVSILGTAVEASEKLIRSSIDGLHHVRVLLPAKQGSFNLNLDNSGRETLFLRGKDAASTFLNNHFRDTEFGSVAGKLQLLYGEREAVEVLLEVICNELNKLFPQCGHLRAYITLPYDRKHYIAYCTRISTADEHLGFSSETNFLNLGDNDQGSVKYFKFNIPNAASKMGLSDPEFALIPKDRNCAFSAPVFINLGNNENHWIGSLCVDSDQPLETTGWSRTDEEGQLIVTEQLLGFVMQWGQVLGRMLV